MATVRKGNNSGSRVEESFLVPIAQAALPFTGERMTSAVGGQIEFEHYHRYCIARDLSQGREVLDVASGEGYGAAILATSAKSVVGVEIDQVTVEHSSKQYISPNLQFRCGNALELPVESSSIDVAVSFETLEHVREHDTFLAELKRVLRPGGLLVISTPDRVVYSSPGSDPNPHHVKELTQQGFETLLLSKFKNVKIFWQKPVLGSLIASDDTIGIRTYDRRAQAQIEETNSLARAPYLVALASDDEIPHLPTSLYSSQFRVHDIVEQALRLPELLNKIQSLEEEIRVSQQFRRQFESEVAGPESSLRTKSAEFEAVKNASREREQLKEAATVIEREVSAMSKRLESLLASIDLQKLENRSLNSTLQDKLLVAVQIIANLGRFVNSDVKALKDESIETHSNRYQGQDQERTWDAYLSALLAGKDPSNGSFTIVDWGDKKTEVGVGVNVQPDGRSAMWIQTTTPLNQSRINVHFGHGMSRPTHRHSEDLLTVEIPQEVIDNTGHYPISLIDEAGDFHFVGTFAVTEPRGILRFFRRTLSTRAKLGKRHESQPHANKRDAPKSRNSTYHNVAQAIVEHAIENAQPIILGAKNTTLARHKVVSQKLRQLVEQVSASEIALPSHEHPKVSIIIPAYKGLGDVLNCLRSVSNTVTSEPPFEVILIDDCPEEPLCEHLAKIKGLRLLANENNLGFLLSCNKAASHARGEYLCFLNSDTIVTKGWLVGLVDELYINQKTAIAGCMLLNPNGTIQDAGWRIQHNGWGHPLGRDADESDSRYTYRRTVDCVTGACFLIKQDTWKKLDGFDIAYAPAFYEEFDLAFRARRLGLDTVYVPSSKVYHLGSSSYGAERRDELSKINHKTFSARFSEELRKQPHITDDEFSLLSAGPRRPVILVVDDHMPDPTKHAGSLTLCSYLTLLLKVGWRVVYAPYHGVDQLEEVTELENLGIEIIKNRTIDKWLKVNGRHLSYVWLSRPQIASDLISVVRKNTKAQIVYYTHDLHHLRMEREASLKGSVELAAEAKKMKKVEIEVIDRVDLVLSPSDQESSAIRKLKPKANVGTILPYFFSEEDTSFRRSEDFEKVKDIVFVGGFPHTPNVDAALLLAHEIMPKIWLTNPESKLILVGYAPPPQVEALASDRIVVTGHVPDIKPYLSQARLMLAPLRYGAGVKGKVIEALRYGLPVVTTPIGAEGMASAFREVLIVCETVSEMVAATEKLLADPVYCEELSAAGATLIASSYSRAIATKTVNELISVDRCAVCGSTSRIDQIKRDNFRESFVCFSCYSLARTEAIAEVLSNELCGNQYNLPLHAIAKHPLPKKVHEFGFVGAVADVLRGTENYTYSEFFPGVELGGIGHFGVRCEDMTRLTYSNDSFDIVLSQDVMEHVPSPELAFQELHRVLKPGGVHLFTIPYNEAMPQSITRARLKSDATVEYLLPRVYHGDPVREEGALVFTDFGADLSQLVSGAGLELRIRRVRPRSWYPQDMLVFEARKPLS